MAEEKKKNAKPGFFSRVSKFFTDLRGEIKKVVWPTKKQVLNNTVVVLVMVIISAILIGGFDILLNTIRDFALSR